MVRPVVVVSVGEGGSLLICPVSSSPSTDGVSIPLSLDDFARGGLDLFTESYVLTAYTGQQSWSGRPGVCNFPAIVWRMNRRSEFVPFQKLADFPGLNPLLVEFTDLHIDPPDLFTEFFRDCFIVEEIRNPHDHLERVADVVGKNGELGDIPLGHIERLLPESFVQDSF